MMEQWTLFPTVLQRKFLLTLLAGIASAGISAIICVATKDHILLALGIIVLCACLISCRGVWVTAAHKNYEVVEGICAGISTPMLRRYRKVHLISGIASVSSAPDNSMQKASKQEILKFLTWAAPAPMTCWFATPTIVFWHICAPLIRKPPSSGVKSSRSS